MKFIIALKYTQMKSERGVRTECAYTITFASKRWRRDVVETPIILPNVYVERFFKSAKAKKNVAGSQESLQIWEVGGRCGDSGAD